MLSFPWETGIHPAHPTAWLLSMGPRFREDDIHLSVKINNAMSFWKRQRQGGEEGTI